MRKTISYRRAGAVHTVGDFAPGTMLLDHLRLDCGATGTKEGCREGDCGACTVAIARPGQDGGLDWRPVNSCILPLGAVDGAEIVTVEDLAEGPVLHPVQQAFVDQHASQCGFCTPGFVMALFALFQGGQHASRQQVADQIAGNLCRCTGYRPIVDAGLQACDGQQQDRFTQSKQTIAKALQDLPQDEVWIGDNDRFFAAPRTLERLAELVKAHPDATIVAGATDVGLWITKQFRDLPKLIYVGRVEGFRAVRWDEGGLFIAAGATYQDAEASLARIHPDVSEILRRLGSRQVRASGTIGGNIANGSPIGDSPPVLIALGATLTLRRGSESRDMPLEDFFIDYGKQDRRPGEFVASLHVPPLQDTDHVRFYKISKRFDQDISALLAAIALKVEDGRIVSARLAFGGMAATPRRATATEEALTGLACGDDTAVAAAAMRLADDFTPISDMRASAGYRMQAAIGLIRKACAEIDGQAVNKTRVLNAREAAHG